MAQQQNFRTAFNGFNREDVVHYLEYINAKHTAQINQLTAENEELRQQLNALPAGGVVEALQAEIESLQAQLDNAMAENAALEERCAQPEQQPAPETPEAPVVPSASAELEAYRRAERAEREARERADLVYYQANGVLTEASAKVDGLAADITDMADQVMAQLTQLQMAVSSSKQALQDASSIMNTIRPNK